MPTKAHSSPPPRAADDGPVNSQPRASGGKGRILWSLFALAFGVSFTNLAIGLRAHRLDQHHEAYYDQPREHFGRSRSAPAADDRRVRDGELVTRILRGDAPFPEGAARLKYRPGTLRMSHAEALQHCFVNATHYRNHIADRPMSLVSLSDHYKIIYRNIPKSSSSSSRHAMQDFLKGDDHRMHHDKLEDLVHKKNYDFVSFVREPLNRFYSSYDEAYFR